MPRHWGNDAHSRGGLAIGDLVHRVAAEAQSSDPSTSAASYVNNGFTFRLTPDIRPAMSKNKPDRIVAKIHAVRGLPVRIAEACEISRQCVHQWTRVPPQHVLTVASVHRRQDQDAATGTC